jgi:hypothetical protein
MEHQNRLIEIMSAQNKVAVQQPPQPIIIKEGQEPSVATKLLKGIPFVGGFF